MLIGQNTGALTAFNNAQQQTSQERNVTIQLPSQSGSQRPQVINSLKALETADDSHSFEQGYESSGQKFPADTGRGSTLDVLI